MAIQPAVKKETVRIAWGTLACFALVCAVALITGTFDYTIVLGGLLGGACAIVCFLLLGLTVQHIVEEGAADQKRGKKRMRVSYLLRLILMAARVHRGGGSAGVQLGRGGGDAACAARRRDDRSGD